MAGRPFRFGIISETFQSQEQWFDLGRRAEALGYDTLLVRDHLAPDYFGPQFAPMGALAALAGVTSTLRLGTMVIANDFRHPVILVKEAATLDVLTGGRFELGIGAGWLRSEYEATGLPFDAKGIRVDRLAEALPLIRACFSNPCVDHRSRFYQVTGYEPFPQPVTPGGPPILIGAGQPRMLRLAGQYADIVGLLTVSVSSGEMTDDPAARRTDALRARIQHVRDGAGDRFDQIELSIVPDIVIMTNRSDAVRQMIAARGWSGLTAKDVFDMPAIFIGSVDEICAQMEERRADLGISYFVVPDRRMEEVAPIVARLRSR